MVSVLEGGGRFARRRRDRRLRARGCQFSLDEIGPPEAGVPRPTLGVEDLDLDSAPRRSEPVPGDEDLGPLADDVPPEPDPPPAGELESEAERRLDAGRPGRRPGLRFHRRLEEDEEAVRTAGEGRQAPEPLGEDGRARSARRRPSVGVEVEDEEVDEASSQDRGGEAEGLVEGGRDEGDEPLEPDPPGDGLDRIEASGAVDPADDPADPLDLGGETEGDGRRPARPGPPNGEPADEGDAARPEDRIEGREAARHDPLADARRARATRRPPPRLGARRCERAVGGDRRPVALLDGGDDGEGALDPSEPLRSEPRRGPTPASLEGDEDVGDGGREGGHGAIIRTSVLSVKGKPDPAGPLVR